MDIKFIHLQPKYSKVCFISLVNDKSFITNKPILVLQINVGMCIIGYNKPTNFVITKNLVD